MPFRSLLRRAWQRLVHGGEDARVREAADALAQVPIFERLPRRALRILAETVHARTFRREEFLYYENDPGLGFYVVQHGRVRLTAADEHGEAHVLRRTGPGDLFGELALLGDFPRTETAQAVVETRVLGFFRPDLKTMRQRHPKTATAVIEALAERLAHRQVELVRLVAEGGSHVRARRLLENAVHRPEER